MTDKVDDFINWWKTGSNERILNYPQSDFLTDYGRKLQKIPHYAECQINIEDRDLEFWTFNKIDSEISAMRWEKMHIDIANDYYHVGGIMQAMKRNKAKSKKK